MNCIVIPPHTGAIQLQETASESLLKTGMSEVSLLCPSFRNDVGLVTSWPLVESPLPHSTPTLDLWAVWAK